MKVQNKYTPGVMSIVIGVLVLIVWEAEMDQCLSSGNENYEMMERTYEYSGFSPYSIQREFLGPVMADLYTFTQKNNGGYSDFTVIQRTDGNLTVKWIKKYAGSFSRMSPTIDDSEAYLYYIRKASSYLQVFQISSTNGAIENHAAISLIVSMINYYYCNDIYCRIQVTSDPDKIYISGKKYISTSVVCLLSFAGSDATCMVVDSSSYFKYFVMISDDVIFAAISSTLHYSPAKTTMNFTAQGSYTFSKVTADCAPGGSNCALTPGDVFYDRPANLIYMCDIYGNHDYSIFSTLNATNLTPSAGASAELVDQIFKIAELQEVVRMFKGNGQTNLYILGSRNSLKLLLKYDTTSHQFESVHEFSASINSNTLLVYDGLYFSASNGTGHLMFVGGKDTQNYKIIVSEADPGADSSITKIEVLSSFISVNSTFNISDGTLSDPSFETRPINKSSWAPSSPTDVLTLEYYVDAKDYGDLSSPSEQEFTPYKFPCNDEIDNYAITYKFEEYENINLPTWVPTGDLTDPEISTNIPVTYSNYRIEAYLVTKRVNLVTGITEKAYKLITMRILKTTCAVPHCLQCRNTNYYRCKECEPDYELYYNDGWKCREISTPDEDNTTDSGTDIPDDSNQQTNDTSQSDGEVVPEIVEEEAPAAASAATQGAAAASAGAAIVSSLSNLSSPQGLWMSMNQFQLIMLLLLTNAYVPFKVVDYLAGMKSTTCSFGFIPFKKIPGFKQMIHWFDYKVNYEKLDYFGVESGSTFVNVFNVCCIFLIIFILHAIFLVIYKVFYNPEYFKRKERLNKVWYIFALTIYIRLFLQASQFLFLSSFSEIYEMDFSHDNKILSFVIAGVSAVLLIGCFLCSIWKWIKNSDYYDDEELHMFKEFFTGLKNRHRARAYSTMLLMRRIVFIIFLIAFKGLDVLAQLILIFLAQLAYFSVMVWIRPFKEFKNNLMEIINELFFISLIIMLLMYNKKSDWTKKAADAYLGLIMANSGVIMAILFLAIIVQLVKKCFKKKAKTEPKPQIVVENTQRSVSTPHATSNAGRDRSFSINSRTNNLENTNFELENSPANFSRNQPQRKKDWWETYEYDPNRVNRQRQMDRTIE